MGYQGVQFAGFFETPAKQLKQVMDDSGVISAGSHTRYDMLLDEHLMQSLEYNHTIGNELIICPSLPEEFKGSVDAFKRAADSLNEIGRKCNDQGFTFGYHNHDFEFSDLGSGKRGFEILYENTDPNFMKMELDCYWALHAGFDPLEIIKQNRNRCVSLHIKDMKRVEGKKVSTEVGQGELDIQALLKEGRECGVDWFTIEQEDFDKDTLESAYINLTNIKELI
nr:sugar phosphate isomerase/epimerase [Aquibacillus saliphilus]